MNAGTRRGGTPRPAARPGGLGVMQRAKGGQMGGVMARAGQGGGRGMGAGQAMAGDPRQQVAMAMLGKRMGML